MRPRRIRRHTYSFPYHGGPIPEGYQLSSRSDWRVAVAGAGTLAVGWIAAVVGWSASITCYSTGWFGVSCNSASLWLLAPIVGPWPALADSRHSTLGNAMIAVDGVVQLAGLVLVIAGLAHRHDVLETHVYSRGRRRLPLASAAVMPYSAGGGAGVTFLAAF